MFKLARPALAAVLASFATACTGAPPPSASAAANPPAPSALGAIGVQSFAAGENGVCVTSTLVMGEHEAVLVDAQFINSEAQRLIAMIKGTGRHLGVVYITHAHPDHAFGLAAIHAAFPDAQILAHPKVVAELKAIWPAKHEQWKGLFGADLTDTEVDPTPYDKPSLTLEGHTLQLIGLEQGDTADSMSVYVPDARALIAGDLSYAGTHVWMAETKSADWDAWLASLARLQALKPAIVVSGHRAPGSTDDPADLAATAQYIQDFKSTVASSQKPDDVVKAMIAKYPSRKLPIVLNIAAKAMFKG